MTSKLAGFTLTVLSAITLVWGHGYMIEPAARNACWKTFPGKCPVNYNLMEQFCGGRGVQISHGGKCGVCGDEYGIKNPPNVYPGK